MTDLNRLDATEVARRIASGKTTAVAVTAACLDRIAERESDVQAFAYIDREYALAQAKAVDRRGAKGVLAGVPVAFKDVIDTCDMPTQYNSPIYTGYKPHIDAACAALVRHAGGIVLGKTVTTEFASRMPGLTRNPLNLAHTPGGSSSGSAAAVADWMVPVAFGTQTGGSTIRPAAYCGIVGYKPSFGTINRAGMKQLAESLDTIGVMGRSVEDCALLVHATSQRRRPDFSQAIPPRIGYCRTARWEEASDETHALLEDAAGKLARGGAVVREVALPDDFHRLYDEQVLIMNFEAARALAPERFSSADQLSEHLRNKLEEHWHMPRDRYDEAMRHARQCRQVFQTWMSDFDVLLTPSAPGAAPAGITSTGSSLFNRNWTLLGTPCVTVPAGGAANGLPLGVQFVGCYDDDERVLLASHWAAHILSPA